MLKLNLKTKSGLQIHSTPLLKKLNWVFGVALLFQFLLFFYQRSQTSELRLKIEELRAALQSLEDRKAKLKEISADSVALSAAVQARNQWVEGRMNSPDKILVKLEQRQLQGIQFKSFNASRSGGSLKVLAPDTENAVQVFNSVFAGQSGRMTVEEQAQGKALINYTWTR
ncbi:MAG: hypothetical protein HQM08_22340 [Candidatus Riflebacteria bacterium]|nr:hypothetical protein [Candidatus Riflebacteria bacterium]